MDSVKFHIGDIVYRKCVLDEAGMITGITYRSNGIEYLVTFGRETEIAYQDIELTLDRSFSVSDSGDLS